MLNGGKHIAIKFKTIILIFLLFSLVLFIFSFRFMSYRLHQKKKFASKSNSLFVRPSQSIATTLSVLRKQEADRKIENESDAQLRPKNKYLKTPRLLESKCWKNPCDTDQEIKWKMIFVVKSAHGNIARRELIRRTWGLFSYLEGAQFTTIFVVGKVGKNNMKQLILDDEAERYGDILQISDIDTYKNISSKTLGGMQWVVENIPDDVFYTSCDDDVLIKMNELVATINQEIETFKKEELGDFPILCTYSTKRDLGPIRYSRSKYYTSRDDYKWKFFPDFCLGGAYSTSVGIIRHLWEISRKENRMKMDDVWITGVLRQKYGLPRQMVKEVKGGVARHYEGFKNLLTDSRRDFMKKEWERYLLPIRNLTRCQCNET